MIKKVNDIDLRVLSLFTRGYIKDWYIREVAKELKISSRTALLTLSKFEKEGVLKSVNRGKIVLYSINKRFKSKYYFLMAENYKRNMFLAKHDLITTACDRILKHIKGEVLIFGSYAKGIEKKRSDLDIYVIGTYDFSKVNEVAELFDLKIDVKAVPLLFYTKNHAKDILTLEMLNDHILIRGENWINPLFEGF